MSKTVQLTAVPVASEELNIRILKKAHCPNLSNNATISYEVGCDAANQLHIRVTANSNKGYFSKRWMPLAEFQQVFSQVGGEGEITSYTLLPMFQGSSQNNGGFYLAAICNCGLVQTHSKNPRCYEVTDGKAFFEEMQSLMADKLLASTVSKEPAKVQAKKSAA